VRLLDIIILLPDSTIRLLSPHARPYTNQRLLAAA
jgi:hypothetical protein